MTYDIQGAYSQSRDNSARINHYSQLDPPIKFPEGGEDKRYTEYNAYTTKTSDTVYRVTTRFRFGSESQCRNSLTSYFKKGPGYRHAPKVVSHWERGNLGNSLGTPYLLFVADFNVSPTPPADAQNPLQLKEVEGLEGVRMVLSCVAGSESGPGEITFVHYPSVEKRMAESVQATPLLAEYFKNQDAPDSGLNYMIPFGITLGQPLIRALRQSDGGDDTRFKIFDIKPPRPHELFSRYSVHTTRLTESVIRVQAMADFKTKDHCILGMDGSANAFLKKFNAGRKANNQWYRIGPQSSKWFTSGFYLTPGGIELDSNEKTSLFYIRDGSQAVDFAKGKNLVFVEVSCSYNDNSHWGGMVQYEHRLTEEIAGAESNVMNP